VGEGLVHVQTELDNERFTGELMRLLAGTAGR
jgi:hypothetical protein